MNSVKALLVIFVLVFVLPSTSGAASKNKSGKPAASKRVSDRGPASVKKKGAKAKKSAQRHISSKKKGKKPPKFQRRKSKKKK